MTSHQCWASSWTRSTLSTTLMWCNVDEIQNSAVSFLAYSFSDSFFLRFQNSCNHRTMRLQEPSTTHTIPQRTLTAYNFSSLRSHL